MKLETITWKIEEEIGHLVFNQPPANAMTQQFFKEFTYLANNIFSNEKIKAIIVYGNGRHFSVGADRDELFNNIKENLSPDYPEKIPEFLKETIRSFHLFDKLTIPTFAAIRGTCFGSAMELALYCKYRICAEGTVLGFPETSFDIMPGCGGTVKLPEIIGISKAVELVVSGRNFSATEAYNWGIIHKIVNRKILFDETLKMAKSIIARCDMQN
jgi:enoyl-CoA hydratase